MFSMKVQDFGVEQFGVNALECNAREKNIINRQNAFLFAYAQVGTALEACKLSGVNISTPYRWNRNDSFFYRERLAIAHAVFSETIESLIYQRIKNPKANLGTDSLIWRAIQSLNPQKFNQQPVIVMEENASKDLLAEIKRQALEAKATALPATINEDSPEEIPEAQKLLDRGRNS